jgi:hypothetical protein
MTMSLDPQKAHADITKMCAKHKGNLQYVAGELGVARWSVLRWVLRLVKAGYPDPRGEYAPGGTPVPQRRRGGKATDKKRKPTSLADLKRRSAQVDARRAAKKARV